MKNHIILAVSKILLDRQIDRQPFTFMRGLWEYIDFVLLNLSALDLSMKVSCTKYPTNLGQIKTKSYILILKSFWFRECHNLWF